MKKFFGTIAMIAAAAIATVGCQKVAEELEPSKSIQFTALEDIQTKTVFGTPDGVSYPVLWTDKDSEIYVSLNLTTPVKAARAEGGDESKPVFKATFPETSGSCMFVAISPASALAGVDAANYTLKYNIPSAQTQEAHSADQAAQILYGYSSSTTGLPENVDLHFGHINAYMKIAFTGVEFTGVKSAKIATEDVALAGTIGYNPISGKYSVAEGVNEVTVNTASAQEVWFGVNPCDLSSKSLSVTLSTEAATYTKTITLPASAELSAGKIATFSVDMTGCEEEAPNKDSIKILAVGNSFSVDAMQYLYPILSGLGYKEIKLGNLYIGGCSLETHATNVSGDAAAYTYYVNTANKWTSTASAKVMDAVKSEAWDYISFQQASPNSGQAATYDPYLGQLISAVSAACPKAKIIWNMTWAYQANANYSGFANYDYDEAKMYSAIVAAVKEKVASRSDISLIIPAGTAVANVRTSFIKENTSRDGYHLNYGVGRLTAAYMWAKAISGADISALSYVPESYTVTERELAAIKEAVNAAYAKPYEVTKATDTDPTTGYVENTAFKQALTAAGYNMDNYDELPYGVLENSYYNSSSTAVLQHKNNGITAGNLNQFAAVPYFFTKDDLPNGTLLVVAPDYMYRPEGWTDLHTKTTARPANVTYTASPVTKIDSGWWGEFKYRSFNIAKIGNPALTDAEQAAIRTKFAIFVPKPGTVVNDPTCDEIVEAAGKSVSDYVKIPLNITHNAYYYSGDAANASKLLKLSDNYSTGKYFSATRIFPKAYLPNGTLIVVRSGYMYRPEAWTALNAKTTSRPGETSTSLVEVDDAWWGSFNYRAFNLRNTAKTELTADDYAGIENGFCIYVPKSVLSLLTTTDMVMSAYGYDLAKYTKISPELTHNAYYNSSNKNAPGPDGLFTTASNSNQFAATPVYDKTALPVGSVLVQLDGYQYRPDGWVAMSTANAGANRPGNVTTMVVVVTDAWWGSWNYRAFNLAKKGNPALSAEEQEGLKTAFAIYVPKK